MTSRIRRTTDMQLIERLHSLTFPSDAWIDPTPHLYWVAEVDGHAVGFVSAELLAHRVTYIDRVGVIPRRSHAGLGRRLLNAVTRWAKRAKQRFVISYVMTTNGPSLANFVRTGFRVYSPLDAWAGRTVVYFIKELWHKQDGALSSKRGPTYSSVSRSTT